MADEDVFPDGEFISLTVRTLAGTEMSFPQVNVDMLVRELKGLISEQREDFPVKQQKLIKGSKTLEDDKMLMDYGLKSGDTIHLVKNLGGEDDEADDTGPNVEIATNTSNVISVIVPQGARAGTRLLIQPQGREQMSVTVPQGLQPGDRFQVRLPPRQQQQTPPPQSGGGQIMQVQCPPNSGPGQSILIEVPGRGRMRVQVPQGVRPGQMFRFRLPN